MIGDLLLRKETPLVLPPEGSPAIGLRCKITGDRLSWSGTRLCPDCVPCGTAKLLLFATVCGLRSLRSGRAHAPCGRVQIRLLAERLAFGHFGPFQVLGLSQLLILWSGLAGRMMLYVIRIKPNKCTTTHGGGRGAKGTSHGGGTTTCDICGTGRTESVDMFKMMAI
ncbi:hypothetical protein Tco_1481036 [Tanacetum coccineum]